MRLGTALLTLVAGCGRIGFEPPSIQTTDAGTGDGATGDDATGDGAIPTDSSTTIACADMDLGSALGRNLASGTTVGTNNDDAACSGAGPEVTFGWIAPATATYVIDLCDSDAPFDSVMYVRNASCVGQELGCDDDTCGAPPGNHPRITLNLTAGQGIVVVVDSKFIGGNYALAIEQQ